MLTSIASFSNLNLNKFSVCFQISNFKKWERCIN